MFQSLLTAGSRGTLHKFWLRGRAIRKGVDFADIGWHEGHQDFQNYLVQGTVQMFKILVQNIRSDMRSG